MKPTGLDLDEILEAFARDCVLYTYEMNKLDKHGVDNGTRLTIGQTKQALTRWGLEQRLQELEKLKRLTDNSVTRAYITKRVSELQANLQDGEAE